MTARAIADRNPPGVSRAARSSTSASAARACSGSSTPVARTMITAFWSVISPRRNAAAVPGSLAARSAEVPSRRSIALRDWASASASSSAADSCQARGIDADPSGGQPGAGRCRMKAATAPYLRAATAAPSRSHAAIAPTSSEDALTYASSWPLHPRRSPKGRARHRGIQRTAEREPRCGTLVFTRQQRTRQPRATPGRAKDAKSAVPGDRGGAGICGRDLPSLSRQHVKGHPVQLRRRTAIPVLRLHIKIRRQVRIRRWLIEHARRPGRRPQLVIHRIPAMRLRRVPVPPRLRSRNCRHAKIPVLVIDLDGLTQRSCKHNIESIS